MGNMVFRGFRQVVPSSSQQKLTLQVEIVTRIPEILRPYHRSLALHIELVDKLRKHSIGFERSREIINQWAAQPWLESAGWEAAWEDICEAEVEGWNRS